MHRFEQVAALREFIASERRAARKVGFVPTMGNLHAGHHALIDEARHRADCVVASVFVNPAQFGPDEDFARYPRTPERDARGLAEHGCDAVFFPSVEEIYPNGVEDSTRIHVPVLGDTLEGACRPGHFDGVATVVAKLFSCVQPDVAVFGRKDYQQLLVVRRMVGDLGFPIDIIGVETRREPSGLALSSRNHYLDPRQRQQAALIYATLRWMQVTVANNTLPFEEIEAQAAARLVDGGLEPDYVTIRRSEDLATPDRDARAGLIALAAARIGGVRLIDNLGML